MFIFSFRHRPLVVVQQPSSGPPCRGPSARHGCHAVGMSAEALGAKERSTPDCSGTWLWNRGMVYEIPVRRGQWSISNFGLAIFDNSSSVND